MPPKQPKSIHPNSLQNLEKRGRTTIHDEHKTGHEVSLTPTAWNGLKAIAKELGCKSTSELFERLGRRELHITEE